MDLDPTKSSLDSSLETPTYDVTTIQPGTALPPRRRLNLLHYNRTAFFIAASVSLVIVTVGAIAWFATTRHSAQLTAAKSANYATKSIPLESVSNADPLQLSKASTLTVNGQLQVNNTITLKPTTAPANPMVGQLYFDQKSNQPYYYNGSSYVSLSAGPSSATDAQAAHVSSFGGFTGAIGVGNGLQIVNGQLLLSAAVLQATTGSTTPTNTQVNSVQGQVGSVVFTAGSGIGINGTTFTNTGVTSLGGSSGAVAVGRGIAVQGGALKSTVSLTAGSPNLAIVDDGNGNYTITDTSVSGSGQVTLGPTLPQNDSSTNTAIAVNKTAAGGFLQFQSSGVDKFVVNQAGKITIGSIDYSQVTNAPVVPTTYVTSVGGASGALTTGSGIGVVGTTISNTGVTGLTGTANQVIVSSSTGNITVSLPQSIAVGSSPTFTSLTLSGGLSVAAASSFAGNVGITGASSLTVGTGATSLGGTLSVAGTTNANGAFNVAGATSLSGTLNVVSSTTLLGTLSVSGASTFTGLGSFNSGVSVVNNSNIAQTGSGTLSTGTGAISLNGATSITGTNTLTTGTGTVKLGSLGTGLVQANATGVLSSGAVDRNGASYFVNNLNVANGGTGSNTFTTNGVLYGNGSGALGATAVGLTGDCLVATTGAAPSFGSCAAAAGGATPGGPAGGDLSGTYPNPSIAKLQGTTLSLTGLTTGQVVQYNGTNIVNGLITNTNLQAGGFASITGTGALASGSIGAGFGTISTGNNITTTATVQGATVTATGTLGGNNLSINGAAFAVSSTGAITAATGITSSGSYTQTGASANSFTGNTAFSGDLTQSGAGVFTTGTGGVTLNGNTAINGTKTLTVGTGATSLGGTLGVTGLATLSGGANVPGSATLTTGTGTVKLGSLGAGLVQSDATGVLSSGAVDRNSNAYFSNALNITNGGTGSNTAGGALTNLGAAASGANGDITSLSALTSINNGAALTIGNTTKALTLQGNSSSVFTATSGSFVTTVGFTPPTANVRYNFPAAAAGTYDICTTVGNCSGSGGVGGSGTVGTIPVFNGAGASVGDSLLSQSGGTVTVGGTLAVNAIAPTAALLLGVTAQNVTVQGATVAITSTSGAKTNTLSFATPSGSNHTVTLPNASGTVAVSASGPLAIDAAGNITCSTCVTSGGGSGGASSVDSVNSETGALTLQGTANQVVVTNSSSTAITLSLPQDINTSSSPTFSSITATNNLTVTNAITAGSGTITGALGTVSLTVTGAATAASFNALSLTANATGFSVAGGTALRTLTVTANVTLDQNLATTATPTFNALNLSTALSVANGGTGATSAANARTNLGAAASGTNGDITNITGLTTALSAGQGGTGVNGSAAANGKLLIGNGTGYTLANLTQGTGIAVTNGSGSITVGVDNTVCTTAGNCLGGGGGGASTSLNNLASVAINTSLLPGVTNAIDAGSALLQFRSGYFATGLQAPLLQTAATATASTDSAALSILTGNATGTTSNSGALSVDTGTATGTTGTITIGGTNASGLTLGRVGLTVSLPGGLTTSNGNINTGTGTITSGAINGATIGGGSLNTGSVNGLNVSSSAIDSTGGALSIGATNATLTIGSTAKTLTLQGNGSSVLTSTTSGFATTVGFTGTPTGCCSL